MFRIGIWTAMRIALVATSLMPVSAEAPRAQETWDWRSTLLNGAADVEGEASPLPRQNHVSTQADAKRLLYADIAGYALKLGPALALLQLPPGFAGPAASAEDGAGQRAFPDMICPVLEAEARARGLPPV